MERIYQDALGGWIRWDGTTKTHYATEGEAMAASKKTQFCTDYAKEVKALLDTLDNLVALKTEFLAREYQTTLTDADAEPAGFLVADLYAAAGTVDAIKAVVDTAPNAKNLYTVSA